MRDAYLRPPILTSAAQRTVRQRLT